MHKYYTQWLSCCLQGVPIQKLKRKRDFSVRLGLEFCFQPLTSYGDFTPNYCSLICKMQTGSNSHPFFLLAI